MLRKLNLWVQMIGFVKVGGKQAITIPLLSEKVFEGRCRVPPKVKCQVLVEPTVEASLPKGLQVANVLARKEGGKVPVRVMNSSERAIRLTPRCRVAVVSKPCEVLPKEVLEFEEEDGMLHVKQVTHIQADEISEEFPVPVQVNYVGLTPTQCEELKKLLRKYKDVFSKSDNDYGYTEAVMHDITTGDAPPIKQRHRRVPPQVFQEFRKHVQDLVCRGILKKSSSPWASPAVIVKKKDGSVRFCCDYRRLNQVTCKHAYPPPRVEESLDALGNAQLFSTLDLTAGYFQLAGKTANHHYPSRHYPIWTVWMDMYAIRAVQRTGQLPVSYGGGAWWPDIWCALGLPWGCHRVFQRLPEPLWKARARPQSTTAAWFKVETKQMLPPKIRSEISG